MPSSRSALAPYGARSRRTPGVWKELTHHAIAIGDEVGVLPHRIAQRIVQRGREDRRDDAEDGGVAPAGFVSQKIRAGAHDGGERVDIACGEPRNLGLRVAAETVPMEARGIGAAQHHLGKGPKWQRYRAKHFANAPSER